MAKKKNRGADKRRQAKRAKKRGSKGPIRRLGRGQRDLSDPSKPMSEVLSRFADPLIDSLPESPDLEHYASWINVAAAAWNAAVVEQREGPDAADAQLFSICTQFSVQYEQVADLFEELTLRKKSLFARDLRQVTEVHVKPAADGFAVSTGSIRPENL